jgi:predicted Zn-dependent protease
MGNAAYGRGELAEAARYFRAGLALDPAHPVLANNLASLLGEAGCPRAGEALLRPVAATLGGDSAWRPALQDTLAELAARPGRDPDRCTDFPP